MRVLVVGGTGLVGTSVVRALRVRGHAVRVVTRHPPGVVPQHVVGACYIRGDITIPLSLQGAADGCAAVVHVAGSAGSDDGRGSPQAVNVDGTRHVLAESQRAGVPFFIYVSALGAERGMSPFHRSKRQAEMLVRAYPGRWLVLRPGTIYGRGGGLLALYLEMMRTLPVMPGVGDVDQRFQPISADDFGKVVSRAVERPDLTERTFEIAGAETTSQRELHRRFGDLVHRHPKLVMLPTWSVRLALRLLRLARVEVLGGVDHIAMLREGNVLLDDRRSAVRDVFGVEPLPLHEGLRKLSRDAPDQLLGYGRGRLARRGWLAEMSVVMRRLGH